MAIVCCFVHIRLQTPLNAMRQMTSHVIISVRGSQSKPMRFGHSTRRVIGLFVALLIGCYASGSVWASGMEKHSGIWAASDYTRANQMAGLFRLLDRVLGTRFEQGHGYITEAVGVVTTYVLDVLHAQRVEIVCDARNTRSSAVAQRLGFVEEGRLRNVWRYADGTLADELVYALTPVDTRK